MEILQLDGLEPQLFNLIGPLAMNPKVLRANNNYPFKTTATSSMVHCRRTIKKT